MITSVSSKSRVQVLKRINSEIEARRKAGENLPPPPKTAIAGPEYFGLNQPEVGYTIPVPCMTKRLGGRGGGGGGGKRGGGGGVVGDNSYFPGGEGARGGGRGGRGEKPGGGDWVFGGLLPTPARGGGGGGGRGGGGGGGFGAWLPYPAQCSGVGLPYHLCTLHDKACRSYVR